MDNNEQNKWIVLTITQGETEARVIQGLLECADINVRLTSTITQSAFPFTVDGLGEIKILVPESEREKAQSILDDYKQED